MPSITSPLYFSFMLLVSMLSTQSIVNASENTEENGLIKIKSSHSVTETINRLETALEKKGMTIFTRVDHTAGAATAGLQLRPTELLIFGNPKVGTPLMLCSQTAAIDLPQKALAYEDESGKVWLVYNDPEYIAKRHLTRGCEQAVQKVSNALANFAKVATD